MIENNRLKPVFLLPDRFNPGMFFYKNPQKRVYCLKSLAPCCHMCLSRQNLQIFLSRGQRIINPPCITHRPCSVLPGMNDQNRPLKSSDIASKCTQKKDQLMYCLQWINIVSLIRKQMLFVPIVFFPVPHCRT